METQINTIVTPDMLHNYSSNYAYETLQNRELFVAPISTFNAHYELCYESKDLNDKKVEEYSKLYPDHL